MEKAPPGTPEVVVVTLLDEATMSDEYRARIMENRRYYADKHGMLYTALHPRLRGTDNRCLQDMLPSSQMFQIMNMAIPPEAGLWYLLCGMP